MAKYDFKCKKCGAVEEKIVSWETSQGLFFCPKCLTLAMERQFSPQGTVFQIRWGKPKVRQKVKRMGA